MIPRDSNGSDGDGSASNDKLIPNALAWLNITTVLDYVKDIVMVMKFDDIIIVIMKFDDKLQIMSN